MKHKVIPWTKIMNELEYLKIIRFAENLLENGQSLAEYELEEYNRR